VEIPIAAAKAGYCLGTAAAKALSPAGWRRAVVRSALHMGVVARLAGLPEPKLYGAPAAGAGPKTN
jgi:succinoglycan biosynthesis protein ExoM